LPIDDTETSHSDGKEAPTVLTVDVLGYALDALSQAEKVAASNISNDQTPGYSAKTYSFKSALANAIASGGTTTLSPTEGTSAAAAGTDGNNVNLSNQLVAVSADQLQTQAVSDALNSQFQILSESAAASAGGTL